VALSLRLHIPLNQMLSQMDSAEIAEYIAYDLTQSDDWQKQQQREKELEASRQMTPEQFKAAFMAGLGGKANG